MGFSRPEKGGCFCNHCVVAAKKKGFDLEEAKELLVLAKQNKKAIMDSGITAEEYLKQNPVLKRWLDFRCESINNFYNLISTRRNPSIRISIFAGIIRPHA